jgi:uncharacterized DUF497 family protein
VKKITYDPAKPAAAPRERAVDFDKAAEVFGGPTFDYQDDRFDYGETRMITVGRLGARMVIVVWTLRGDARHIISMRKANAREQTRFGRRLGEA